MTRAALYARISTNDGRQHLDNQLRELRTFAGLHKWQITAEYTDEESGANPKRPGLEKLMHGAARRRFDLVLVFALSRLTRGGPMQAFHYISRLSESGVTFWSMTEEHFRTSGPAGEMLIAIAAYIAEQERAMIRERISAGLARAKANGKRVGRPPAKLPAVKELAKMRDQGKSLRAIAKHFNVSKDAVERRLRQ